jgi:dTDP-4-dehydrorhamnose 3,5-epimerase
MSNLFEICNTLLNDLYVLQRNPLKDQRGYLERLFCSATLKSVVGDKNIKQINHTLTIKKGTVRGLHFQYPPFSETKLVSCIKGEIFDIAVDLRYNSPTFLHWHAELLSEYNHKTLVIPEGFGHGFQTLSNNCEIIYLHTMPYMPEAEGGLNIQDSYIAIKLPLAIEEQSIRDQQLPMVSPLFKGIKL